MAFPDKYLNANEDIVLDLRPHLWSLAEPFSAVVLALAAWVVLSVVIEAHGTLNDLANWVPLALLAVAVLWFLVRWTRWRTTSFVVTTDRLVHRAGVVAKQGKEIPLERINDISFSQTIFERLIGAGDLMIESGGEQGQQRFSDIRRPMDVQNEIYRQMERSQGRDLDRMAGRRELSVPEQLEKLAELRDRGVLTPAEFDAKKQQLLEKG